MNTITALRGSKRRQQVNVFLDGKLAFTLNTEIAAREDLHVGQGLSSSQIEVLVKCDRWQRCLNAALHYLSYRPRSESEMREQLNRRGFDSESIVAVITHLKDQGLVDDRVFAQFWKDNRQSFRPRSLKLTKLELRRKGVTTDIIDQIAGEVEDDESAYQAALKKTRILSLPDYDSFRRQLSNHLRRRGYSYEVINRAVKRVWQERQNSHQGVGQPGTLPANVSIQVGPQRIAEEKGGMKKWP